jgi:threonine dehydrogenase-like Zn-dependent dehydrogenase
MKALVKYSEKEGAYEVREVSKPKVGNNDVLIQMKATAICGTDISLLENKYKGKKPIPIPIIPGHEGVGIITDIGKEVKNFQIGDRVAFEALQGCGQCTDCKLGNKNMCQYWEHLGLTCDGTFAEYILVPCELVHKLPDNISFRNASCLEPMGLTVRSLSNIKPALGETATIIGPGKIGLFHLQALKASGVTEVYIIGLDRDKKRLEIAEKLGASAIINADEENPLKKIMDLTGGRGVDIVIETAYSPECFSLTIELAAPKARVSAFGLYLEAIVSPIQIIRKGLTICGDVALLTKHFIRAIRWLEIGKVLAEPIITRSFPLEEAEEAVKVFKEGTEGAIIFEN